MEAKAPVSGQVSFCKYCLSGARLSQILPCHLTAVGSSESYIISHIPMSSSCKMGIITVPLRASLVAHHVNAGDTGLQALIPGSAHAVEQRARGL